MKQWVRWFGCVASATVLLASIGLFAEPSTASEPQEIVFDRL